MLAPAETPLAIVDRPNTSVKVLFGGDAKSKLFEIGMEPAIDDPKPLGQVISEDIRIHADLALTL